MSGKSSRSPVIGVAAVVSLVLIVAVGTYLFTRPGPSIERASPPPLSTPAAPVATPAPAAQPTPVPTPKPTPVPTRALPSPTPLQAVRVTGSVRNGIGDAIPEAQLYLIPKGTIALAELVRAAFAAPVAPTIVKADLAGAFAAEVPAERAYILGLMVDGEPVAIAQEIAPSKAGETVTADFLYPRAFELRGSVLAPTGERIPDIPLVVSVVPSSIRGGEAKRREQRLRSDADGRFAVSVIEPDKVFVTVDIQQLDPSYTYRKEPLLLVRSDFGDARSYRVDLELVRAAEIAGVVTAQGEPIADATVTLREVTPGALVPSAPRSTKSDAEGRFSFTRLYPTLYALSADHPAYNPAVIRDFDASSGEEVSLALIPFAVTTGTIALTDAPKMGASVTVSVIDRYDGSQQVIPFTGDVADFRFEKMKPGAYLLLAESQQDDKIYYGELPFLVEKTEATTLGRIEIGPLREVRGMMILPPEGGVSANSLAVTATPRLGPGMDVFPSTGGKSAWRKVPSASASDSLTFALDDLRWDVAYDIAIIDRSNDALVGGALVPPRSTESIRIALGGVGVVSGQVLNSGGEACTDAEVELVTGLGIVGGEPGDIQTRRVRTDLDGRYTFPNVPVGQGRVRLAEDDSTARLVTVVSGGALNINLQCRSYVSVMLEVLGPPDDPVSSTEQFLILPRGSTRVKDTVQEFTMEQPSRRLEPGTYTMTRTKTMESRPFDISLRLDGILLVDFSQPAPGSVALQSLTP